MNSRNIKHLDKYLAEAFTYADEQWDNLYPNLPNPFLSQTYRSVEYQNMLYSQGRKSLEVVNTLRKAQGLQALKQSENKVITKAIGGKSKHNSNPSKAFDIAFFDKSINGLNWDDDLFLKFWNIIKIKYPLVKWGGNFQSIRDLPHFEL
jgi:peptidoglycan L-alanyl-D-glutamate endopeptidase CwlK